MDATFWLRQSNAALFPELEWNKPERRNQAGHLLIVGGNSHALTTPAKAYDLTKQIGIGQAKIVLPSKTKKLIGSTLPDAIFLPSTSTGELSQEGNNELIEYAQWANTILLPGDVGRNSQTTILLESLLKSYTEQIILTRDAVDSLSNQAALLFNREMTTLVVSFSQLQRLLKNFGVAQPLQFSMDLMQLVEYLHTFTSKHSVAITTFHQSQLIIAQAGKISTTKIETSRDELQPWRLDFAALSSCYKTWYPNKSFEALTHTAYVLHLRGEQT